MDDVRKKARTWLPITLSRAGQRGVLWHADLDTGDTGRTTPFAAEGRTKSDAGFEVATLIASALGRWSDSPVLVIGGGPDYATWLHLILPQPHEWVVYVVRDGIRASSWHSDHGRDELLQQVRDHVGGQPTVLFLKSSTPSLIHRAPAPPYIDPPAACSTPPDPPCPEVPC
jgi:hypothetical protein